MFIQSKYKTTFIILLLTLFIGSCKPYKSVLEEEKQNELIKNSIQSDYEIENIYQINKKSTLELNLQEGKRYKFQFFSKKPILLERSTYSMDLLDAQLDTVATNHNFHGDFSYFSRTLIFECKNTGIYNLKLEGKRFPNSSLLAVASQDLTSEIEEEEEYVFVKNYYVLHKSYRSSYYYEDAQYTCVFYKGVTYKYTFEKGIATLLFYNSRRELIMEYTPSTNEKEIEFKSKSTGIYFFKIINPQNHEDSVAMVNSYFNLTDSAKSKLKIVSLHQISKEGNKITKVFAEDTTYFFRTKGCGESIKVEILEDGMSPFHSQEFEFKNGEGRFIFRSRKTGIYHIKVTKMNPNDNHETTLIIEK